MKEIKYSFTSHDSGYYIHIFDSALEWDSEESGFEEGYEEFIQFFSNLLLKVSSKESLKWYFNGRTLDKEHLEFFKRKQINYYQIHSLVTKKVNSAMKYAGLPEISSSNFCFSLFQPDDIKDVINISPYCTEWMFAMASSADTFEWNQLLPFYLERDGHKMFDFNFLEAADLFAFNDVGICYGELISKQITPDIIVKCIQQMASLKGIRVEMADSIL